MTTALNSKSVATKAFKEACKRIKCAFVEGDLKTTCRRAGWHISLAEPKEYGISVTPLEFVQGSLGKAEANRKLKEHRLAYAKKLGVA